MINSKGMKYGEGMKKLWGNRKFWLIGGTVGVLLILGLGGMKIWREKQAPKQETDKRWELTNEIFDLITENYWEKTDETILIELYNKGLEKLGGEVLPEKTGQTKEDLKENLERILVKVEESKRDQFVVELSNVVLANLKPFGRSGIYGQQQQTELKDNVNNVNKVRDLYQTLGTEQQASESEIAQAYDTQVKELKKDNSASAAAKLEEAKYAYEVLTNPNSRKTYDTNGAEPTVFSEKIGSEVYYIKISKMSPTTYDEFNQAVAASGTGSDPANLILDLRGNIGGAVDAMPYMLGPFIGEGQYAYEFFHQGERAAFKTRVGWWPGLTKFKQMVVLVDAETQSSAELMASVLKKYNVGVVVGTTTKGWGTIERVFELKSSLATEMKLGVFLVHNLTLGDDNQPIEGKGVVPNVEIKNSNWREELAKYVGKGALLTAVEGELK